MLSHVWSCTTLGVDALPVEIETHIDRGLPKYTVVGLADGAVRESRDRIWAALKNSGIPLPRGRITINLAPADVRKEGAAFDLPITLGLLNTEMKDIDQRWMEQLFVIGEVALDGKIRPVRGVLPMALLAREKGCKGVIVPRENAAEAAIVQGLDVFGVSTVKEAVQVVRKKKTAVRPFKQDLVSLFNSAAQYPFDLQEVQGQHNVKRALEVAAAGGHNILMVGPPGSGKTMLARRVTTILPPMTTEEALETTKIHSVSGFLKGGRGLIATRPFRAPHHTTSDVGLCGGGVHPTPGEISLAHHGVLFLDELPEFKRQVLEVLRQPLEEGFVHIRRARFSVRYPARFMLVASMNPCPCGYLNDPKRRCVCAPQQVQRYRSKISGPLLDRIDMHVEVYPVPFADLNQKTKGEASRDVRTRVMQARGLQTQRFLGEDGIFCNAQMRTRQINQHCASGPEGQGLLKMAIERLGLSGRAYHRVLKLGRTVADLAGSENIEVEHLSEAIQYRSLDRSWGKAA